jgi:hypothetical protein
MITNQPPPPAPATESFIRQHILQLAAVRDEHDEIRRLKREIEKRRLEQELAALSSPTQQTKQDRKSLDFYANQIRHWHDNLPPDARRAPRSMIEILSLLQGRTPGSRPHAPEVAEVLRQLGWSRKRCWQGDGGRRLWWKVNDQNQWS